MAEIINMKATIAKSALTSFMSYGALNRGFCLSMFFGTILLSLIDVLGNFPDLI